MVHLRVLAFNHSCDTRKRQELVDQDVFFVLGGIRLLNASMAASNLCRRFQKSPQRSPFSFSRAKTVFMFKVSGSRLGRNSRGNSGTETGACGKARTEYAAANGRPWAFCCTSINTRPAGRFATIRSLVIRFGCSAVTVRAM